MADSLRFHSKACDVLGWFDDQLTAAGWPAHPVTGRIPQVGVGDSWMGAPTSAETVDVVMAITNDNDVTIDWKRMSPPGRDEAFTVRVVIRCMVDGQKDRRQVLARWNELAEVVQGLVWNPTAYEVTAPGEDDWSMALGGGKAVLVDLIPHTGGWWAEGFVAFGVVNRI